MDINEMGQLLNIEVTEQPEPDVLDMLDRNKDKTIEGVLIRGSVKSHLLNASIILENHSRMANRFSYNEFNDQIYVMDRRFEDEDITETQLWLHRVYGVRVGKDSVYDLIVRQAKSKRFHPLQEYLLGLEWDGVSRLETLLQTYWGVQDTELLKEIGLRWAISCVARAIMPGAKVDTVLILCGPQGAYKSTSLRVLAGDGWFSDSHLDISRKESYELIHSSGVWIWEMAENYALNKSDVNNAKMFLSAQSDRFRPSYGRTPITRQRSVVFVSTTNEPSFLTDGSGNRRYWPVNIGQVDLEGLERDRDQIWAEAMHLLRNDEPWWLDESFEMDLFEYQEEFVIEDPWEIAVNKCADMFPEGFICDDVFTQLGLNPSRQTRAEIRRVSNICKSLGLKKHRFSKNLSRHPHLFRPRGWIC
jgi:putative DNA primase/helicase